MIEQVIKSLALMLLGACTILAIVFGLELNVILDASIIDLIDLLLTLAVTILIPLFLLEGLEKRKSRKQYVIDEIRSIIELAENFQKIIDGYASTPTELKLKQRNSMHALKQLNISTGHLRTFLEQVFGKATDSELKPLRDSVNALWKSSTGAQHLDWDISKESLHNPRILR